MHDVALRRRIAALVIAALLAISGAALASAYFAVDDQAKGLTGTGGDDTAQALKVTDNDTNDYLAIYGNTGSDTLYG